MSRFEKLLKRFLFKQKDFTYDGLTRLLAGFGYENVRTGKTAGLRVAFMSPEAGHIIKLHIAENEIMFTYSAFFSVFFRNRRIPKQK